MTEHADVNFKRYPSQVIHQIQSYESIVCDEENKLNVDQRIKLGWIEGVLIPCLLNIWGVMLFLRLPWIVAQAGIFDSIVIIFISLIIIVITTFSLSAISTNGRVKGGGLYFIISRAIGPEFGVSIGLLLALANTISVALNTIGFCLSLRSLLQSFNIHTLDSNFEFTFTGFVAILFMEVLCCVGMDGEAKVRNILLVFVAGAIFDVIIGTFIGPTTDIAISSGFTGFSIKTFKENWYSSYRLQYDVKQSFFTIFTVFFPSVTGIQAGANISGDLKDPSTAIPKGTLLSILITITSYVILIVLPGAVHLREASGNLDELQNGTYLDCSFRNCSQGLYHNENLMQTVSLWPYLIYLGCFAATLSTALTALIDVPKILQRMGQDDIYPFLKYLAKGYGKSNEPFRAHFLAVLISSIFLLIGELNVIASFISTIFLCAYGLINLCTFHVEHFKPLGWRPTYKFYNKWLSLAGAILCFIVTILIDKTMSVVVGCVIWILYMFAAENKNVVNWGSSKQSQQIKTVLKYMYKANVIQYHVKNYLPNIMVLSGEPKAREELVYLAHLITNNNGLQVCVNVKKEALIHAHKQDLLEKGTKWLKQTGIKSLYNVIDNVELDVGVHIINSFGHGIFRPNIILVGYKYFWFNCEDEDIQTYLNILNVAYMNGLATIIVRLPLNDTEKAAQTFEDISLTLNKKQLYENEKLNSESLIDNEEINKPKSYFDCSVKIHNGQFSFVKKRKSGTVDVWWLFNNGGLALIIAHIFQSCDIWKKCTFRIFGITSEFKNLDMEKCKLKQLLAMYRVQFDFIDVVLADKNSTSLKTMASFTTLWSQQFINQAYMNGLATIIVRLPLNDTEKAAQTFEDISLTLNKKQLYENEKLNSESLIDNEEINKPKSYFDCSVKIHNGQFSFVKKRKSGTVDVWWLFNNGGLALIIAHIFQSCDIWKKCTFRIFGITSEFKNLDMEKCKLKQLLAMYRVQFDFIDVVLADKNSTSLKTMASFTTLWSQQFINQAYMNGLATIIVRLPLNDTEKAAQTFEDISLTLNKKQLYENEKLNSESLIDNEEINKPKSYFDCSVKIHNGQFSFVKKRKSGTVDVWWLFNNGGLALIIAHIFQSCDIWKKCTFRIFGITSEFKNLDMEKCKLKQLLAMYRVQFDFIDVVLADKNSTSLKTMASFTTLWSQQFINQESEQLADEKYNKKDIVDNLYIKDLLEIHSMQSDLIILSTSKVKENVDKIYMYWMEIITRGLPPCIIIQGNTIQTVTASA